MSGPGVFAPLGGQPPAGMPRYKWTLTLSGEMVGPPHPDVVRLLVTSSVSVALSLSTQPGGVSIDCNVSPLLSLGVGGT